MTAYDGALAHARRIAAVESVADRTSWDQETMMPPGAVAQRAEELAALEVVLHDLRTDPAYGELLDAAVPPDDLGEAQIREMRRARHRALAVPADLAAAIARETSLSQGIWAEALADEDPRAFVPALDRVIGLKREEAQALAGSGDPYDALLDDFEPQMTSTKLDAMFATLRPRLVALLDRIRGANQVPAIHGEFSEGAQMALGREMAQTFGYDVAAGRLDRSVHPFSSGSGQDVRITTRVDPADPLNSLYSTIHEVGHAVYEQNVEAGLGLTPLGRGASMGMHESQSRLFENQLGRSRAFCGYLHGRMTAHLGDLSLDGPDELWRAVNRVGEGFVRTEADEVQYNLHVALRFDLERELIAGTLRPANLDEAWSARFAEDFGYPIERPAQGFLQDIHWAEGLFGYFPSYTLGNLYAATIEAAMRKDDVLSDRDLAAGDLGPVRDWLARSIHRHGARYGADTLLRRAVGGETQAETFLAALETKFAAIYDL